MIILRLPFVPVRLAWGTTKLGYRTGRLLGWRRVFLVGVGVAIGLLVAPVPGRELRARLRERLEAWQSMTSPTEGGIIDLSAREPVGTEASS